MKRSPAEYYLMFIRRYGNMITSMSQELRDLREACGGLRGISYDGINVQTSKESSPIETAYINAMERADDIAERMNKLISRRSKMINQIRDMENPEYAELLSMIFIDGRSPENIQDAMGYSDSWFWHNRRKALRAFMEQYDVNDSE